MAVARTAVLLAVLAAAGCQEADSPDSARSADTEAPETPVRFVDIAGESGLAFRHTNGATPHKYFPETAGGGGMFWDFDDDGLLDIYLVNSGWVVDEDREEPVYNALYHNTGAGKFAELAARAGVDDAGYGMGCAGGDYDNDGDPDLFVTNYGPNSFYRNDRSEPSVGPGSFTELSQALDVADGRWGTGSAFADYDRDGDLDLYVANYVDYLPKRDAGASVPNLPAQDLAKYEGDIPAYPHPGAFRGSADILYRNEGGSGFREVTREAGVFNEKGKGLGVVFGDCNGDGWPDLYVANDLVRNFLFINQGDGSFEEVALRAGTSFGQDGKVEAGMGADFGDYDNDGDLDITVTNFQKEPNSLYRNEGNGFFANETFASGIGLISLSPLGFGTGFFDYDNDGLLDLFVANGHVLDNVELFDRSTTYPQANQLLRNLGSGKYGKFTFADVTAASGPGIQLVQPSRGSASGDYDNDGDIDLLVVNLGETAVLLRNDGGNRGNWLSIETEGVASNRDGIGARVRVVSGHLAQTREVRGSRSYLSQSDLRMHFGLGQNTLADTVHVSWPAGGTDLLTGVRVNQFLEIREGTGTAAGDGTQAGSI